MESDTTEKPADSGDNQEQFAEFAAVLNTCESCKENCHNKEPKLLPCLHTICGTCLSNLTVEPNEGEHGAASVKCPSCDLETAPSSAIGNLFASIINGSVASDENNAENEDAKICTGCEESVEATSFCTDCVEYLCDQCVQAHRRVRITKDHTIQPKDTVKPASSPDVGQPTMMCPIHKQELLKLYCETCEKLTCRDCQLLGHKDHKYQFVDEAADNYKKFLTSLLEKIREKKTYVENAKALIEKRNAEITEKEQKVAADIKAFIMKVAQELNKRGKQLMLDLQNICKAKKGQLDKKNTEVQGLSKTLYHTLKFAEFSLEKGNNAVLMYTKKSLNHQLRNVLKIRCEVPNPYHIIDMKFGYDPKTPLIQIPTLGSIFLEGIPFHQHTPTSILNSSGPMQQPQQLPTTQSQPNHHSQSHQPLSHNKSASQGVIGGRPSIEEMQNLSHHQKTLLMMKMKKMQEHQQRQQQGGYHGQYNRPVQQSTSPSSSTGLSGLHMMTQMQQMGAPSQHLTHLPHQSSCISSSNGQNLRNHGNQQPYFPPPLKGPHPLQSHHGQLDHMPDNLIQINLGQLQDRRNQQAQMAHQAQYMAAQQARSNIYPGQPMQTHTTGQPIQPHTNNNNMQNPIVIQPTGTSEYPELIPDTDLLLGSCSTSPGHHGFGSALTQLADCMHSNPGNRPQDATPNLLNLKPEEVVRPSCSFANNSCRMKPETATAVMPDIDILSGLGVGSHSTGSRTPTPRAESTTVTTPPTDHPLCLDSVTPDLETTSNSSSTALGSEDFASFLINNTEGAAAALLCASPPPNPEPMETNSESRIETDNSSPQKQLLPSGKGMLSPTRPENKSSDDRSDDWCAVCHNGGDLLCCDTCPKVFHLNCHVPNIPKFPGDSEDWICGLCVKEDAVKIPLPLSRPEDKSDQLLEPELKLCEHILLELFSHEESLPFHEPVSDTVPNYYKIISEPVDLGTIKKKLMEGHYHSLDAFFKDLQLIFSNCSTYNLSDSVVGLTGKHLEDFFHSQLQRYAAFINQKDLLPVEDSQVTDSEIIDPATELEPPRKKKRTKSADTDDDWTVETPGDETDDDLELKRKFKRQRSGRDDSLSEPEIDATDDLVHVH